jgi:hypothetical protein
MAKMSDTEQPLDFQIFFYSFKRSQHDSLIMTQNVSDFYLSTTYQNVYLISDGNGEANDITLMSNLNISLNSLRLKSTLVLTNDT